MDNIQGESPGVVTNECVRRILRAKARATLGWGGGGIETGGLPSCGKCPACFLHLPMDSYRVLKGLQMNREEEQMKSPQSSECPRNAASARRSTLEALRGKSAASTPSSTQGKSQFGREASQRRQSPRR